MTIQFDRRRTSARRLKRAIESTGFDAVRRRGDTTSNAHEATHLAPPPENSPAFLVDALQRARDQRRPVILDFHAPWCGPCRQFEAVTFTDAEVREALASVELVKIDLDEHPQLASTYGVTSVPHRILADTDGLIVARVVQHEGPEAFLRRLTALGD